MESKLWGVGRECGRVERCVDLRPGEWELRPGLRLQPTGAELPIGKTKQIIVAEFVADRLLSRAEISAPQGAKRQYEVWSFADAQEVTRSGIHRRCSALVIGSPFACQTL